MKIINIVLSGGVGSRLWPLSRKSCPKQYLPIFEEKTLFQKTVERNSGLCDQLMIVGNKANYELSRKDVNDLGITDYAEVIEACPRNTAAAIAFAALSCDPEDVLFVTPSDHLITSGEAYSKSVERAIALAKEDQIVTFGLKPTRPETGFGYIEAKGEEVKGFREKPDLETAKLFLEKGNFLWNSGMFCFKAQVFLTELEQYEPEVYHRSQEAIKAADNGFLDRELSMKIPSISVDYAVMERTQKIKVVPSSFGWSDMGSFESVFEYMEQHGYSADEQGNMIIGSDIHTEFVGLENTILVQTKDAILVLKKESAQEVKKVFEKLEKNKPDLVN
ncbi:mannose-1-phosphate guanylyltransferase [Echinicola strongylocentroti]|uniref:Mannose-1-phosphate guanylyltransferase n=1 Tax=Echinicola strongylocentroti TaxID=1795355 RepID=A0A2Z4IG28_9BACT|nr:mannose-1-phosphate guanylyltransferase [Echinicola strongylocentroti]AWW29647.1 mannose-1-phosphate guanylyltransferase [Echinicola strongylocentroti]